MPVVKDLIVSVIGKEEQTLTLRTTNVGSVALSGDFGLYDMADLEEALKLVKEFRNTKEETS